MSEPPRFTRALRGYDRRQVDDYVSALLVYLEDARAREQAPEPAPGHTHPEGARPSDRFDDLGARVAEILRLAHAEANALRASAREQAMGLAAAARTEAESVVRAAADRAARLEHAVDRGDASVDDVVAMIRGQADELIVRARREAEQQARAVLEDAAARRRRLREQAEHERTDAAARLDQLRAEIGALEQRRDEILVELGRLPAAPAIEEGDRP